MSNFKARCILISFDANGRAGLGVVIFPGNGYAIGDLRLSSMRKHALLRWLCARIPFGSNYAGTENPPVGFSKNAISAIDRSF